MLWYPKTMLTKLHRSEFISPAYDERAKLGIDPDDLRDYCFINGKLKLKHGQFELYYDNGNILAKGFVDKGIRVGAWQYFYEDGKVMQRGFYVSNGRRLGIKDYGDTWEYYNEDGTLEVFCEKWKTIQKRLNKRTK